MWFCHFEIDDANVRFFHDIAIAQKCNAEWNGSFSTQLCNFFCIFADRITIRIIMNSTRNTKGCANASDRIEHYIEMAKTFAALSYQGVYIMDLSSAQFVFSSDYPLLRCGLSEQEVQDKGLGYFTNLIPGTEKDILKDVQSLVTSGNAEIPLEDRRRLSLFLNFHINYDTHLIMVCHKLRFLDFNNDGNPRYMIGLVSPSVHSDGPVILAAIEDTDYVFSYFSENRRWEPLNVVHLSGDEQSMLRLTTQGFSLDQIGRMMFKSVETIKFYRRQVFSKLGVKNISEAIAYATQYGMI